MPKKEEIIYGLHPVIEAVRAGVEIDRILIRTGLKGENVRILGTLVKENNILLQYVPLEKLNKLTPRNHQGVVAFISRISYTQAEDLVPFVFEAGRMPLLLILDGITDVRNLGAAARTAECAGADGIMIPSSGSAQVTEDAIRASAGALLRLPVCRVPNLLDLMDYLRSSGVKIIGATEKADMAYFDYDMRSPVAVVMGSEEKGISKEIIKRCDALVKIPMKGEIDSLNVSVAAGVLLFEAVRQRH